MQRLQRTSRQAGGASRWSLSGRQLALLTCLTLLSPAAADSSQEPQGRCGEGTSELEAAAVKMGDDDLAAPRLIEQRLPTYPDDAKEAGVEGDVYVEAIVDADGSVREPCLIRGLGDVRMNDGALEAIVSWRFEPGTIDGEPVAVLALFTVTYRIR